jgi:hypothetical protein
MHKKISGVEREGDHVKLSIQQAKQEFLEAMHHLRGKKDEYHEMKKQNDEERKRI